MSIRRGTVLGLTGIAGALIERQFAVLGTTLMNVTGIGPLPAVVGWILGCCLGVIAGDVAAELRGQGLSLGRWAGIKKGLVASTVAALGFYASTTGVAGDLLAEPLQVVPRLDSTDAVRLGSIWLGAVLGDLFDV